MLNKIQVKLSLQTIYFKTIHALRHAAYHMCEYHSAADIEPSDLLGYATWQQNTHNLNEVTPLTIYLAELKEELKEDFDEGLFRSLYDIAFIKQRRSLHSVSICYTKKFEDKTRYSKPLQLFIDANTVAEKLRKHYPNHQDSHLFAQIVLDTPFARTGLNNVEFNNRDWGRYKMFATYEPNFNESPQPYMQHSTVSSLFWYKFLESRLNLIAYAGLMVSISLMSGSFPISAVVGGMLFVSIALGNAAYLWIIAKQEIDNCYHHLPAPEIVDINQVCESHFKLTNLEELVPETEEDLLDQESGSGLSAKI